MIPQRIFIVKPLSSVVQRSPFFTFADDNGLAGETGLAINFLSVSFNFLIQNKIILLIYCYYPRRRGNDFRITP